MKSNFITAVICFGVVLFHYTLHPSIMNHPYMIGLVWISIGIGSYNLGIGVAKLVNK